MAEKRPKELEAYLNACECYIKLFVDTMERPLSFYCHRDESNKRDKEFEEVLNEIDDLVLKLPMPISPFRLNFPLRVSVWSLKIQRGGTPSYTDKAKYQTVIVQITNVASCYKVKEALKGVEGSSTVARGEAIKQLMKHRKALTPASQAGQGEEEDIPLEKENYTAREIAELLNISIKTFYTLPYKLKDFPKPIDPEAKVYRRWDKKAVEKIRSDYQKYKKNTPKTPPLRSVSPTKSKKQRRKVRK